MTQERYETYFALPKHLDKVVSMSKGYLSPDPDEKKYPNGVYVLTLCYTTD